MPTPSGEPIVVTIANGQLVSSAFVLQRAERPLILEVPSYAALRIDVQYASISTATTSAFGPLSRTDGSGAIWTIWSGDGPGFGVMPRNPTPYARLKAGAAITNTTSFVIRLGAGL